jgi:hypothetical protein
VLGRLPTDAEMNIGLELLAYPNSKDAWIGYCRLLVSTNEFLFID